ncbi:MAG TPA: DsrE family protein [Methylomirabilota bacterium]|nr:DsrE family protein [Methylomirabilota bacterium]
MRFGFLLTSGCESQDVYTVTKLARAALGQGHEVKMFIMGNGVHLLVDHPKNAWAEGWKAFLADGAEIACCGSSCEPRGVVRECLLPGVLFGSQYDHAEIVSWSDRYLVFG